MKFYARHLPLVHGSISEREFGYGTFGKKIVNRNLFFDSETSFKEFLLKEKPLHVSASVAYYSAKAHGKREWNGMDLVFEFDADAIPTECKLEHDSWECTNCKARGKGSKELCDQCGKPTKVSYWVCWKCLERTKEETVKLVEDFLQRDFGFAPKEIYCNFSGNRGFHTYVRNSAVRDLDKNAVMEIVNYVQGTNLLPEAHRLVSVKEKRHELIRGPKPTDFGWSGRIARAAVSYFGKAREEEVAKDLNVSVSESRKLVENKDKIIKGVSQGYWDQLKFGKASENAAAGLWSRIAKKFAVKSAADVDEQASMDVKKIMRLPESLHGSTGLLAKTLEFKDLTGFDAFKESVVFSSEEFGVKATEGVPGFTLNGLEFGPFEKGANATPPE